MRSNFMRLLAMTAVALVAASSAACSSSTPSASSSTPSASPFAGKTPAQVLAMARAAALAKGSVHVVGDDNASWGNVHWVVDAAAPQGQEIVAGSFTCTFLITPAQVAYLRGDATCLEENLQFPPQEATKYAGRWIAVPSSSSEYAGLIDGVTDSTFITDVTTASAPLRFTKPTTIDGKSVIGISGGLGPGATGSAVLYISTAAPYLPVACIFHGTQSNGQPVTGSRHMSDYGESVVVTEPAHSIPLSLIPGTS